MEQLLQKLLAIDYQMAFFPIREYWLDIGRIDDYNQTNGDFYGVFGKK